jgi:DNA repair photolyase
MRRPAVNEVRCKSAINRVQGMPFKWSLNPYRGCSHGCHYCYARATHAYLNLDAGEAFTSILFAKVNLADVLRRELSAPSWRRERVSVGTATDPYQPIEGRYRLTRAALQAFVDFRTPAAVITKSTMVIRDVDLLQELGRVAGASVCVSVPTVDEHLWRVLEPGTPPPTQRLKIVASLTRAGVEAGVALAPLLPGLTADQEHVAHAMQAAKDHGARFVWTGLLRLDRGVREHYLGFVRGKFPELLPTYLRLYRGQNVDQGFARRANERAEQLKAKLGLEERREVGAPEVRQLSLF